jgi:RNA polymerase sigma-70 factor (ECF subfamily)
MSAIALRFGYWSSGERLLREARAATPTVRDTKVSADETRLLQAVGRGERERALHELYQRYARRIYGLGKRLLGDPGLAEELVQETFLRLWRTADRFDPSRGSAQSFIYAIARRLAIDLWRRPSSRPFLPEEGAVNPEGTIDRLLLELSVRDALDSLSDAHRQVLELSYKGDLTQAEIATRLGLSVGTVKSRTFHALRNFQRAAEARGLRD